MSCKMPCLNLFKFILSQTQVPSVSDPEPDRSPMVAVINNAHASQTGSSDEIDGSGIEMSDGSSVTIEDGSSVHSGTSAGRGGLARQPCPVPDLALRPPLPPQLDLHEVINHFSNLMHVESEKMLSLKKC